MPLLIDAIEAENDDDWITPIETEDVTIPNKLDTGFQMDILPLKDYENIRAKKRIIKNSVELEAYNNQSIPRSLSLTPQLCTDIKDPALLKDTSVQTIEIEGPIKCLLRLWHWPVYTKSDMFVDVYCSTVDSLSVDYAIPVKEVSAFIRGITSLGL
ncbi:hypothetical protein LSH36_300g02003 [Paralvinella palmiformis]|uniref:Uncharacterized protein n=1 Tax=Paralvinella palmiformis TaxID=53620 RepID=A0AAD9JID3_9ANNE|nr:hypothetical protein LSH36_300g02003 [Paralvinella palmiformis]